MFVLFFFIPYFHPLFSCFSSGLVSKFLSNFNYHSKKLIVILSVITIVAVLMMMRIWNPL
ncbi:hypothetical protein IYZ83_004565 [Wolbachia pipientis]|uniref:hypothetical protein n=1 Tax=Wolbachia pipientis TaxID=955 RepID=UPI001F3CA5D0|nr:hypothetical protein [Wolbachia pipientis]UIP91411.1 hypothetical protein IYZ83_004565 [Wolbachia pipientis]